MPNSRSGVRITARAAQKWAWRPVRNRAAVHAVIGRSRRKESGQWGRAAPLRLLRLGLLCFRLVCGSFAPSLGCRLFGGLRLAALGRRPAPFDPIALGRVRPQPPHVLTPSCWAASAQKRGRIGKAGGTVESREAGAETGDARRGGIGKNRKKKTNNNRPRRRLGRARMSMGPIRPRPQGKRASPLGRANSRRWGRA